MRRRSILSSGGVKVTLSSYSRTVEPNASSISITAYANGQAITDATSSMITKDGSKITSATINSNGVITMSYSSNTSTSYSKTGWVKFTYKGQTVQFNLTQSEDYVYNTTTTPTTSYTRSYDSISDITDYWYTYESSIGDGYCNGVASGTKKKKTVTKTTYYYKSGRTTTSSDTTYGDEETFTNEKIYFNNNNTINLSKNGESGSDTINLKYPLTINITLTSDLVDGGIVEDYAYCNLSWTYNGNSGTKSGKLYFKDAIV